MPLVDESVAEAVAAAVSQAARQALHADAEGLCADVQHVDTVADQLPGSVQQRVELEAGAAVV